MAVLPALSTRRLPLVNEERPALSTGRLPISFSEAGFASQAEYDAAKAGPQTPLAGAAALAPGQASFGGSSVFGAGATPFPTSATQQSAQMAATQAASRLPQGVMPIASPQSWMPGAARTFSQEQMRLPNGGVFSRPGTGTLDKATPEADSFVANADARAEAARMRAANIAAAKKLPDTDPNSFAAKRAAFNQASLDEHMDAEGNIVKASKAQKDTLTTLDEADAAARAAQAKADAMKAKAVSKLAADENKAEKERQKAAEMAAKNTPAAVSQRLTQIISPISAAEESPISAAPPPKRLFNILNAFSYPRL